jgi:release factor glutamine methyltransferase
LDVEWVHSDWWSALGQRRFDLVLSNPPYVAEGDPHLHALAHEPALALTSGPDGLDALSRLAAGAGRHLAAGGRLLLEHGHEQAAAVRQLLSGAGFHAIETRLDLAGHPRCSGGVLQATPLRDAGQA